MPDLRFQIEGAEVLPFAASPSLLFRLRIENREGEAVRSLLLQVQIRIATMARPYTAGEQEHLAELFGPPGRWGDTLKSLLWGRTTLVVPAFTDRTVVEMPVPCTYDFDVIASKYLDALEGGEVPLELLFSGTVFYSGGTGLQAEQIPWDREAQFRLPVRLWREMMQQYFPNSAWLRLRKDVFDRLYRYRVGRALNTWEETVERLLAAGEEGR